MKIPFVIVLALIGNIACVDSTKGECDQYSKSCEESMSIMETILLFPLSLTPPESRKSGSSQEGWWNHVADVIQFGVHTTRKVICQFIQSGAKKMIILFTEVQKSTVVCTEWITEFMFTQYLYELLQNENGSLTSMLQLMDSLQNGILDTAAATLDKLSKCVHELKDTTKNIEVEHVYEMICSRFNDSMNTLANMTYSLAEEAKDVWQKVNTIGKTTMDWIRYLVATIMAISMVPFIRRKGKTSCCKSKQTRECLEARNLAFSISKPHAVKRKLSPILELSERRLFTKENHTDTNLQTDIVKEHYLMCEIFDGEPCNCGGIFRAAKQSRRDSTRTHRPGVIPKSNEASKHYLMCEFFDSKPCNCDGKVSIPCRIDTLATIELTPKSVYLPYSARKCKAGFIHTSPKHRRSPLLEALIKYSPSISGNMVSTATTSRCNSDQPSLQTVTDLNNHDKVSPEIVNDNGDPGQLLPQAVNGYSDQISPQTANDNDESALDISMESDIGEPCCNSSFKEESPYIIRTPSVVRVMDNGDGPDDFSPTILTKRSPQKELGMSFHEESFYSSDTFDSYDGEDSLLDVSDINKSLSYSTTDGAFEFAVLFAVQCVYRLTKRFLSQRSQHTREQSLNFSRSVDTSGDIFIIPRVKQNDRNRSRSTSRNTSFNATDDSLAYISTTEQNEERSPCTFVSPGDKLDSKTESLRRCLSNESFNLTDLSLPISREENTESSMPFVYNCDSRQILNYIDSGNDDEKRVDDIVKDDASVCVPGIDTDLVHTDDQVDGNIYSHNNQITTSADISNIRVKTEGKMEKPDEIHAVTSVDTGKVHAIVLNDKVLAQSVDTTDDTPHGAANVNLTDNIIPENVEHLVEFDDRNEGYVNDDDVECEDNGYLTDSTD